MSRARVHEVSSPISLFPFIGILLCTMGALLVVLVAVSRSARTTAQRQVQVQQDSTARPADDGTGQKLQEVGQYVGRLGAVRGEAERKLRDEQQRLSHIEDHIRRLHEKIHSLESAAVELHAMEQEHYDDRQQAEREVERLHQLIEQSQKTIASMREEGARAPKSYAVVPYEGPNGTFRRPIYVECVKNELILQPEGVRILADDLRPPQGAGNPLATVLRAARDHLIRMNPEFGKSRDAEPYPVLLVRPGARYDRALNSIEAGDFDVGIELAEEDWKLKFPQPDPQLASIEEQALVQARARQKLLAAAAPQVYRSSSMAAAGEFDFNDTPQGPGGFSGSGGGGPHGGVGDGRTYTVPSARGAGREKAGIGGDTDDVAENGASNGDDSGSTHAGTSGGQAGVNAGGTVQGVSNGIAGAGGSIGSGGGGSPAGGAPEKNLVPDGYETPQNASVVAGPGAVPDTDRPVGVDSRDKKKQANLSDSRGNDWALGKKPPRAVPVRRTIHVAVDKNQVAIVPEPAPATVAAKEKAIPMKGDTVESIDEFVKQVREHADGWGIAGDGLYWRPVVLLHIGPDGQRRADDLARLLKNSGLEIRTDETARNLPQGNTYETR